MFSVLIPVYNFDVTELVKTLHQQAVATGNPFEIIVFDDNSEEKWKALNKPVQKLKHVELKELSVNLGRSKIRNALVKAAKYDFLIFMDCDVEVPSPYYIQKYLDHRWYEVMYGGRTYTEEPPEDIDYLLRWKYGEDREQLSMEDRNECPYKTFLTNNFAVQKKVLELVPFDETIKGYGHEDTLLALELKQREISIHHIDNPLVHIGLEPAEEYLQKTENALKNLWKLYRKNAIADSDVKILSVLIKLKRKGLLFLVRIIGFSMKKRMLKNLYSASPKLWVFDFYKLYLLARIASSTAS